MKNFITLLLVNLFYLIGLTVPDIFYAFRFISPKQYDAFPYVEYFVIANLILSFITYKILIKHFP
ncbi:hypothetical protein [Ostreibacterium oceani]|uniref:Uncharacterized protein n=1 Tax=Ostreibacterium oceani TaxID=2654998 RepID=A0A6N7ERB8_9GAMM|nr:hypothetical protein [Ostreibacterium oceani]MPV85414.1 hypothetical protein [Ostreibacterium oceani]